MTTGAFTSFINGIFAGPSSIKLTGFAKIEEAAPGQITFIANPKYAHFIESTKASAVLVSKDFDHPNPQEVTLIKVDDPYATLAELLRMIQNSLPKKKGIENPCFIAEGVEIPEDSYIGAFAYIGKGAVVGKGTQIYPQSYIGDGASIGDNCIIYSGVKVYDGCKIGNRCI